MIPCQITEHTVRSDKIRRKLKAAVVTDLHNGPCDWAYDAMADADCILVVGDLPNRHRPGQQYARMFIDRVADMGKPVFYAIGNHEKKSKDGPVLIRYAKKHGFHVLDNRVEAFGGITIGGFSSSPFEAPSLRAVRQLQQAEGFRLLLCHHPEYYNKYIRGSGIELTLSGHAHGGQICLLGRGLYAPGQGFLPRYTQGYHDDGHLLISRGMTNSTWAPRLNNPCEMILLTLLPSEEEYAYE
ncbi:MAG: metallophosphoesterase [Clostridia bacterium]|nr:metallophosphoesterase [Clostridia bacterium]